MDVRVGWAEFDTDATPFLVCVGWVEFDVAAPNEVATVPAYRPGGGVSRYHSYSQQQYDIPVDDFPSEADEEEIIISILLEISSHVLL